MSEQFSPHFNIPENHKNCGECLWSGPSASFYRHLKTDHPEIFITKWKLPPGKKSSDYAVSQRHDAVYDIKVDGFLLKTKEDRITKQKTTEFVARLKWDLENPKRKRYQSTFVKAHVFFDAEEIEEAISKSRAKQYEKSGGEKAQEFYNNQKKIVEKYEHSDCPICTEEVSSDNMAIFLDTDGGPCSKDVAHVMHKSCRSDNLKNDLVTCGHCRKDGAYYPFKAPPVNADDTEAEAAPANTDDTEAEAAPANTDDTEAEAAPANTDDTAADPAPANLDDTDEDIYADMPILTEY